MREKIKNWLMSIDDADLMIAGKIIEIVVVIATTIYFGFLLFE